MRSPKEGAGNAAGRMVARVWASWDVSGAPLLVMHAAYGDSMSVVQRHSTPTRWHWRGACTPPGSR